MTRTGSLAYNRAAMSRFPSLPVPILFLLLGAALAWAAPASAQAPLAGEALIAALRAGGHTLYFRHEATDWSQADQVRERADWSSCDGERMRQLSAAGRANASATGQAMRRLGIPVARVLASPYCRTMESARLLGYGEPEPTLDVLNLRVAEAEGGRDAIVARARRLLATPVDPGANVVVVAHGNVARAATPAYPGEGEALVFRADGAGGFELVGRLPPAEWQALAR